jgi:hypothetical protein
VIMGTLVALKEDHDPTEVALDGHQSNHPLDNHRSTKHYSRAVTATPS